MTDQAKPIKPGDEVYVRGVATMSKRGNGPITRNGNIKCEFPATSGEVHNVFADPSTVIPADDIDQALKLRELLRSSVEPVTAQALAAYGQWDGAHKGRQERPDTTFAAGFRAGRDPDASDIKAGRKALELVGRLHPTLDYQLTFDRVMVAVANSTPGRSHGDECRLTRAVLKCFYRQPTDEPEATEPATDEPGCDECSPACDQKIPGGGQECSSRMPAVETCENCLRICKNSPFLAGRASVKPDEYSSCSECGDALELEFVLCGKCHDGWTDGTEEDCQLKPDTPPKPRVELTEALTEAIDQFADDHVDCQDPNTIRSNLYDLVQALANDDNLTKEVDDAIPS